MPKADKQIETPLFDEEAAADRWRVAFTHAAHIFGTDTVVRDQQLVMLMHDNMPDDADDADDADNSDAERNWDIFKSDIKLAAETTKQLGLEVTCEAVEGVYDRVLSEDAAGEPEHLEAAHRIASTIFNSNPNAPIDARVLFAIFDREFVVPDDE